MRKLINRYETRCVKCTVVLEIGKEAMYEKTTGIFCVGCEPTEPEDIRHYRQIKADTKADKYDDWASNREAKANKTLDFNREHYTGDIAFNTQPGHIPVRARVIAQNDRAFESMDKANNMRKKSESLRQVVVKGDAKKKWDARAERVREWLKVGEEADWMGQKFEVLKINTKTAKLKSRFAGGGNFNVELCLLSKGREAK